tara:strand:+ start:961 stop:1224 length:264 start_codon:yes stop_codon:yes gene_type:complete
MRIEPKRMGYIIAPPFSKRDNNRQWPTEEESAPKAIEGVTKKNPPVKSEQIFLAQDIYFLNVEIERILNDSSQECHFHRLILFKKKA